MTTMPREEGSDPKRLLFAFGIFGLVIWPVLIWLGFDLIANEIRSLHGIRLNSETILGRDFVNIWHSGREALLHGANAVYDRPEYRRTLFEALGIHGIYAFSYPPHMLMLSVPFGWPPYLWSLAIWTVGGLALFAWAARPYLRQSGLPLWAVLLLPGGIVNLWASHFGFLIGALALLGWHWTERHPARAGGAFALMTVKPHMGILVPLVLIVRGEWRTILWAGLGVVMLVAASLLMFGMGAWTTWFTSTLVFQASLVQPDMLRQYSYMMPIVVRTMEWISDTPTMVLGGRIVFGVAAIGLMAWAAMRRATVIELGLLSIVATPLLLPYVFNYDLVALSLIMLIWSARSPAPWWSPERAAYGAAFLVPLIQVPLAKAGFWISPPLMLLALAFATWRYARGGFTDPADPAAAAAVH